MKAMYNGKELTVAMFGGGVIRGTLESIEIVRDAFQTVYLTGTPFNPDGIVVLAHFSSGETRYVPQEELTFSPTGGLATGTTAVTVDFTYNDVTARATQKISVSNNYIFGVCWNYGEPSSQLTRLTPSNDSNRLVTMAVTTEPVPAVGTGPGSSPFDQHLPWSGMEEYNIVNNAVKYKKGQSGFSRTNYDTVVYIPEFYYRVIDDAANNRQYRYVSSKSVSGFAKHPGSGKYVGRYHAGADYVSKTGLSPLVYIGRKAARTGCQAKGSNIMAITITDASGKSVKVAGLGQQGPQGERGLQGEQGNPGVSPHIGANGNWFVGDTDTGVKAQGPQGEPGTSPIQAVSSVNGKTGAVTLTAADVEALPVTGGTLTGNLVIDPSISARAGGVTIGDPPTLNFGPTAQNTYIQQLADGQLKINAPDIYLTAGLTNPKTISVLNLVESSTMTAIQEVTQEEYDALTVKSPKTLYLVKE